MFEGHFRGLNCLKSKNDGNQTVIEIDKVDLDLDYSLKDYN